MFNDSSAPMYLQTHVINLPSFASISEVAQCALLPLPETLQPLLDPNTGSVLGIAQRVLTTDVQVDIRDFEKDRDLQGFGTAKVGQIFGMNNQILYPTSIAARKQFAGEKVDKFTIDITGLEFNYHIKGNES